MFLLAIALRVSLYHVETSDYTVFLSQWYDFIQTHVGFAALKYNFSNYNILYLYLLTLATYLSIPKLVAIKTISVIFDGVLGLFAYLILRLRYRCSYASVIGVLVILYSSDHAPMLALQLCTLLLEYTGRQFCLRSIRCPRDYPHRVD